MITTIIMSISLLLMLIYWIFIIWIITGYVSKKKVYFNSKSSYLPSVAVVVAMRNEEHNITQLLSSLSHLSYKHELMRFVFVDDCSDDNTFSILSTQLEQFKFSYQVVRIRHGNSSKSLAIEQGILNSDSEIIFTTDADCKVNPHWIESMLSDFEDDVSMIVGPVCLTSTGTLLENLQQTEFLAIQALTAGSINRNSLLMCNGANLAFRRTDYLNVLNNFKEKVRGTGDDTFLMFELNKWRNNSIRVCIHADAIVTTPAVKTVEALFEQRIRWASKTLKYNSAFVMSTGFIILSNNLLFFILLILSLFNSSGFIFLFSFFFLKLIIDGILILTAKRVFRVRLGTGYLILLSVVYPVYMLLISIFSFTGNFNWKNRKWKI